MVAEEEHPLLLSVTVIVYVPEAQALVVNELVLPQTLGPVQLTVTLVLGLELAPRLTEVVLHVKVGFGAVVMVGVLMF
jgi:hypothetical protein